MNFNFAIFLIAVLFVSGCAARQALEDMKQSKAVYQACLAQHPKDASSACKREKEAYEAAGLDYEGMALDSPR